LQRKRSSSLLEIRINLKAVPLLSENNLRIKDVSEYENKVCTRWHIAIHWPLP
jgi:hypothetical protein